MNNSLLKQTAILVFANSPEEEIRRKSLFNAEYLLEEFTSHTIRKVKKTGITYFHYSEEQQVGVNFGERFVNAIQDVFQRGFQYVITLGNDTPQLRTSHILKALEELYAGRTVLGPSADGGFYLMGLSKPNFCAQEFIELPWQTASLRSAVIQRMFRKNVSVFCLETFVDIDTIDDIKLLLKRAINIPFGIKKYLRFVLVNSTPSENIPYKQPRADWFFPFYNKGSPAAFLYH